MTAHSHIDYVGIPPKAGTTGPSTSLTSIWHGDQVSSWRKRGGWKVKVSRLAERWLAGNGARITQLVKRKVTLSSERFCLGEPRWFLLSCRHSPCVSANREPPQSFHYSVTKLKSGEVTEAWVLSRTQSLSVLRLVSLATCVTALLMGSCFIYAPHIPGENEAVCIRSGLKTAVSWNLGSK